MLIAGFDVETTGLDTQKDTILEIGVVLWDTVRGVPVNCYNTLIEWPLLEAIEPRITELTGITLADIKSYGMSAGKAFHETLQLFHRADAICAHNGNLYDRPIFESNLRVLGLALPEFTWVDTSCDIDFPADITTRRLKHLASEHDFLNPFAHRALFDVLTMLKIAQKYDWNKTLDWAKTPTIAIKAETNFQQKEAAKKLNYRWNSEKKIWTKSIKSFQLETEKAAALAAGFQISLLG